MSVWNKVLVGLICFACIGYFYLASRTLKTHQYWCDLAKKFEKRIDQVEKQNARLVDGSGDPSQPSIRQRRVDLARLLHDRGRMWVKCDPKVKLDPQQASAEAVLTINDIEQSGLTVNTILHVFEEADIQSQGRYLGEFRVTQVDPKQKTVTIASTRMLSPRQIEHLSKAKRPWELRELLPNDSHEIFVALTEAEIEKMLPAEVRREYLDDGKNQFERQLRDYQVLLNISSLRRTLLSDEVDATSRDLKMVEGALTLAKEQAEAVKKDVATAEEEAKKFMRQRDAVAGYLKTLQQDAQAMKATITKLIEDNKAMAGRIARLQLEAARRIDQRTRTMAQAGMGG